MNDNEKSLDSHRSFLLMSEITGEEPLSQREISRRLGMVLGKDAGLIMRHAGSALLQRDVHGDSPGASFDTAPEGAVGECGWPERGIKHRGDTRRGRGARFARR